MREQAFDIGVVGGGCIGSSIAHELALRGVSSVALVDSGRRTSSATARSGGLLRVFHESPEHVALALANHAALEAHGRRGGLSAPAAPNGNLYFFSRVRYAAYAPCLRLMADAGHPFDVVSSSEGRARFPAFAWRDDELAIHEPLGGHREPSRLVDELQRRLTQRGASLFDDFDVKRLSAKHERYVIEGDKRTLVVKALVLAGGARLLPRYADLGVRLPLLSRTLVTWAADKLDASAREANYFDRETLEFGRLGPGRSAVISTARPRRVLQKCWRSPLRRIEGADCYAPGRQGFLGPLPGHSRAFVATGWGGTAFKFSMAVGQRMAELLERALQDERVAHA